LHRSRDDAAKLSQIGCGFILAAGRCVASADAIDFWLEVAGGQVAQMLVALIRSR
jgi:hypothetical protein